MRENEYASEIGFFNAITTGISAYRSKGGENQSDGETTPANEGGCLLKQVWLI